MRRAVDTFLGTVLGIVLLTAMLWILFFSLGVFE